MLSFSSVHLTEIILKIHDGQPRMQRHSALERCANKRCLIWSSAVLAVSSVVLQRLDCGHVLGNTFDYSDADAKGNLGSQMRISQRDTRQSISVRAILILY